MIFEKFIDNDLGHVSYIVACGKSREGFIVDPRRDIKEYEEFIAKHSLKLKYIFNSHTHADYVGGHIELAHKYGAQNIFQISAPIVNFEFIEAKDNDVYMVGETLNIKVLETPGHTPFDISILILENGIEKLLFTGDLLFIGEIGRPDLLGEENVENLANLSYQSALKLWNLSDDIIVMTSHIEGSLCGKNLSNQYFSTIGIEKKTNYSFSLCQKSKKDYIENLSNQEIETPAFFKIMAGINISGPRRVNDILTDIINIDFYDIKDQKGICIIDTREPWEFHQSHITDSINICDNSNISLIAGNLIDYSKSIYLIGKKETDFSIFINKLIRVGIDNLRGIINNDIHSISQEYLSSTNIVNQDQINTTFTNILLDKECNQLGNIIQSDLTKIKDLNLNVYDKVIISCNHGYKSSSFLSTIKQNNVYYLSKI